MAQELKAQLRETRGTRNARRQRRAGGLPAVLYGHGQESLALTLSAEEFEWAVRHGTRLVSLTGAVQEQAFIRELQWDTWGNHVLHVDLTRVSEHEKVEVTVPVELRGEAPGVKQGGVVTHALHSLTVECEATAIPEKISVSINHLELDQEIRVADLVLPAGVVPLAEADVVVVSCTTPTEMGEEAAEAGEGEPEVIGRKKEEEESEE